MDISAVLELLDELSEDHSIPRNVRSTLADISKSLKSQEGELSIKIDSALQKLEDLALDPNMSSFARTQIWNLTSLLEGSLKTD